MRTFDTFLKTHREEILNRWRDKAVALPAAKRLAPDQVADHFPDLLEAMAAAVERDDASPDSLREVAIHHAVVRWGEDYDLRELLSEYRILRGAVFDEYIDCEEDMYEETQALIRKTKIMNENVDNAITDAVEQYSQQRDRTRDFFIGILGHDLRNPLNVITLNARLLLKLENHLGADELRLVARVASAGLRMESLVTDLLDFARSRLGNGLPIVPEVTDLRRVISDAVDELVSLHPDREIRCEMPKDAAGDFHGRWDPARLMQAVSNLVGNALNHGSDPIIITAADADADDAVLLTVRNQGEIAPEQRARLFEPFRTGDPEHGTGLGLYIVREIAKAHGGKLRVMDEVPGQTSFRLELPRQRDKGDSG